MNHKIFILLLIILSTSFSNSIEIPDSSHSKGYLVVNILSKPNKEDSSDGDIEEIKVALLLGLLMK